MQSLKNNPWFLIVNPTSSGGRTKKKWKSIQKELLSQNINYSFELTAKKNHASDLAVQAIESGYRNIISVGGDGTHNEVVNGIMEQKLLPSTEICFGVIPGGTGNDWIRTHNIPKNIKKSISIIQNGRTGFQDVGIIEFGLQTNKVRYFINAVGLAYDAYVVKQMSENSSQPGTSLIYMLNILRYLFNYKAEKIQITINGQTIVDSFYTINACIGKYAGGGLMIAPHAIQNDGKLAVTIAYKMSKLNILFNLYRFYNGTIGNHSKMDTLSSNSIMVTNETNDPSIEADGEYLGNHAVKISVIPSALKLYC